jgi:hypothetical protein
MRRTAGLNGGDNNHFPTVGNIHIQDYFQNGMKKCFKRFSCQLEIFLKSHEVFNCVECVACKISSSQESNRVYFDLEKLKLRINDDELNTAVQDKRDRLLFARKPFDLQKEREVLTNELIASYVLHHLEIVSFTPALLEIILKANNSEAEDSDLVILKPMTLQPTLIP